MPTCHDFYPAADGYDLLVGFGTGDGEHPKNEPVEATVLCAALDLALLG